MRDHTENTLRGAAKALTDVIQPSLDPNDHMAAEQLRLVAEYLDYVRSRLDHLHARERIELKHALSLVQDTRAAVPGLPNEFDAALERCEAAAAERLSDAEAPTALLRETTEELNAALTALVRASRSFDDAQRRDIAHAIIAGQSRMLEFERSWYLPYGFDPQPQTVEPLEKVIAAWS